MAQNKTISNSQRAENFQFSTRQNKHMLPKKTVSGGGNEIRFDMPKTRFLSKIMIDFRVKAKITHATRTDVPTDNFTPYKSVQKISLDCNNGYSPYTIGGVELAIYNSLRMNPKMIYPQSSDSAGYCYMPELRASSDGEINEFSFTVEMPIALNDRDPVGLIMLQSPESVITLAIFNANPNALLDNADGYNVEILEFSAEPMLETFSIPASQDAFPDIGVMKIVNHRSQTFMGSGFNTIYLPTNTMYRKIAFYITDEDGNPFEDSDINGTMDIVFNQTDTNYSISPRMLRHDNELSYGYKLPHGVYAFDFTDNGFPNYGGMRDYVDASKLTELWLKFPSVKPGRIYAILEQLSFANA